MAWPERSSSNQSTTWSESGGVLAAVFKVRSALSLTARPAMASWTVSMPD
ncbi:Uncharacterised protein [Bordetella pertussis]|nr:Uncharacterised protein [Bordetella pertussis]